MYQQLFQPGVLCLQLQEFYSINQQDQVKEINGMKLQDQLFENDSFIMVCFKEEVSYSKLTPTKKAYIDTSQGINSDWKLFIAFQNDSEIYQEVVNQGKIKQLILGTQENEEISLQLKDDSKIPMYNIKFKLTFSLTQIEKKLQPGIVKDIKNNNLLLNFYDVQVQDVEIVSVRKKEKIANTQVKQSELFLIFELNQQIIEFNIENPIGENKKKPDNQDNQFMMMKNSETMKVTLEERIFKLERDEQAFIDSIRQINTKQATSINQFLLKKTGGYHNIEAPPDLEEFINKKKLLESKKQLISKEFKINEQIIKQDTKISNKQDFKLELDELTIIQGFITINANKYVQLPRGQVQIKLIDSSSFNQDQNIQYQDIVLKISKQIDQQGDKITYIIKESEFKYQSSYQQLLFDTLYLDDSIKFEVYHKNSTLKSNLIGKAKLQLKNTVFDQHQIIPLQIYSKKNKENIVGLFFVQVDFNQREKSLYDKEWIEELKTVNQINKYTYLDDYLNHEFLTLCHFGYISIEINKVTLPEILSKEDKQASSGIYLLKMKLGTESNQIFLGIPDQIINLTHVKFHAKTSSINDKLSIELYQVISESAFDPSIKYDFKNMRLLSHKALQVRDIPLNAQNTADNFNLIMPISSKSCAALFNMRFDYQRTVAENDIGLTIDDKLGGLLFMRMVQSENFTLHHDKELNKYNFFIEVINETTNNKYSRKLYFNKQILPLGFIDMKIKDVLKITYYVFKGSSEQKEEITQKKYEVQKNGLKDITGVGSNYLIELKEWQITNMFFEFNFTYDGFSTLKLTQKNTLADQLMSQQAGQTQQVNQANKLTELRSAQNFKTTQRFNKQQQTQNQFLLDGILLELEYRETGMSDLHNMKQLDASYLQVSFDRENFIQLLQAKDISENAKIEISNVSVDKRSLRETNSFYANEIIFDMPIRLRLFHLNDTLQIKIHDSVEQFNTVKLGEIPLTLNSSLPYYFQLGSKQMLLKLDLEVDKSLLPLNQNEKKEDQKADLPKEEEEQKKQSNEFAKKVQLLKTKTQLEQLELLKKYVNEETIQNRQLITKQMRNQQDFERLQKRVIDAKHAKPKAKQPNVESRSKNEIDISRTLAGIVSVKDNEQGGQSKKKDEMKICVCGNLEPKFKGYCADCVAKLKTKFDSYLEKFKQVSKEYDDYTGQDQKKADEKLRLMQQKIEQYQIKLTANEMIDVAENYERLTRTDENRNFAEFKVTIQSMKQELEIMKAKQDIELKNLKKQQDFLEMQVAKRIGQRKDIEREIELAQDSFQSIKEQTEESEKRVVMKKKFLEKVNEGQFNKLNEKNEKEKDKK